MFRDTRDYTLRTVNAYSNAIGEDIYDSTVSLESTINENAEETNKNIKNLNEEIYKQYKILNLKFDMNILQTAKQMLIMLTDRRQKIEKEILMIDKEAKELEATIPPPKSICEGYQDCTTCSKNR
jgi:hypothetical protein